MSTTYIKPGNKLTYSNSTGSTIPVNSVVFVGNLPGIAITAIADASDGELDVCGVHRLAKTTPLAITQGAPVYWNTGTKKVTTTVTDKLIGIAALAAVSSATTVDVKLLDIGAAVPAAGFDQAAFVSQIATADGSDPATTQALANANKAKVNALLTSLINAGLMAAS